jgi:hypothetical protein
MPAKVKNALEAAAPVGVIIGGSIAVAGVFSAVVSAILS